MVGHKVYKLLYGDANGMCIRRGETLPQFFITPGAAQLIQGHINEDLDDNTGWWHTSNGWTRERITIQWLKEHFLVHVQPLSPGSYRLLVIRTSFFEGSSYSTSFEGSQED